MEGVKEHYARLLARHYSWMFGQSFEEKVAEQRIILEDALHCGGIRSLSGLALDLGCGPGFQSIALAQLGFSPVVAIDTSAALLDELRSHAQGLSIQAVEDDVLHLGRNVADCSVNVFVCMGDTITHLQDREAVMNLLRAALKALTAGGTFVITYRDLSFELHGIDRFVPVASDDRRVMTCFLEFDRPESVMVHDLIYEKDDSGWKLQKSCYRKLRLPVDWLEQAMTSAGFVVHRGLAGRMMRLVGTKP